MMKKVGLLLTLLGVIGVANATKLLSEEDIYNLNNPFEANVEYIRFEYCKNGLIPFRSIATTPKKDLKASLGFYEFEKEDLKYAQTRVIQYAVKMGKKYNGDKIDKVIGKYWQGCLEMPLEYFANDWAEMEEESEMELEDLDSLL